MHEQKLTKRTREEHQLRATEEGKAVKLVAAENACEGVNSDDDLSSVLKIFDHGGDVECGYMLLGAGVAMKNKRQLKR